MSLALISALVWLALSNVVGMFPSKYHHWPQAYALIAAGLPILVWVFVVEGPWMGTVVLLAAASVLRWPVRYLFRWIRRQVMSQNSA